MTQQTLSVKKLSKKALESNQGKYFRVAERGTGITIQYFKRPIKGNIGTLYVVARHGGQPKWQVLGRWPNAITLSEAREKAARIHTVAETINLSPQLAVYECNTCGQLLDLYLGNVLIENGTSSRASNTRTIINVHLKPALGEIDARAINKQVIHKHLYSQMQAKHYKLSYINKALMVLAAAYRFARNLGLLDDNPIEGMGLSQFSGLSVEPKAMQIETYEIKETLALIASKANIKTRMMCILMLLFATRIKETTLARWEQFDMDVEQWVIRTEDTKTQSRHVLPLTDIAIQVLKAYKHLRRQTNNRGQYLFPAARNPRNPINPSYACQLVSECSPFSGHDFRKVARSWWSQNKHDHFIGETLLLNHKQGELEKTYIQGALMSSFRDSLSAWHAHLIQCGLMDCLHGK
ncbi:tyrosine-type recombinase/integrase [Pseudoalteromonas rubra]|uniref:tyrosine-type recombinase/integrase n=1 Tax=Pseudoalteromonas rubra TaxID=43658 RepID=UPI002DB8F411|nr:tyrosine-type recombinase/integrase [Pseudoalteromonas rubra]MEC4091620.1 tyrosine-type recombinase/integrase [Pseudoalteromonas rubra]